MTAYVRTAVQRLATAYLRDTPPERRENCATHAETIRDFPLCSIAAAPFAVVQSGK